MNNVNFAIPEIYGDSLSYYEVLRELIEAMNVIIDNYDTIPEQIAEAVKNLDAAQLFSAVLNQLIDTIATDNTKSENAVKVYKKHDLLYATFNETVNLYESLIDFSTGTELIPDTNIREVNISELFIELRKLIENETERATAKETELKSDIDAETTRATAKETELKSDIDAETTRATAKETELKSDIDDTKTSVLNEIKAWVNETQHPIGSIYITTNNINPSSIFGGTWEQLKDRFLLATGDTYEAGSTGGEAQHTLTVNEMPEHTHIIENGTIRVNSESRGNVSYANNNSILDSVTNSTVNANGGSKPHNNMPPYLCVYMWKRIS